MFYWKLSRRKQNGLYYPISIFLMVSKKCLWGHGIVELVLIEFPSILFTERTGRSITPTLSETGSTTIMPIVQYEHSHSQHFHHTHPPPLQHQSRVQSMDDTVLAKNPYRICLVGTVVDDQVTLDAAKSLNVPVITSETGSELIADDSWTTYFIMKEFEGPIYEAIYRSKHKWVWIFIFTLISLDGLWNRYKTANNTQKCPFIHHLSYNGQKNQLSNSLIQTSKSFSINFMWSAFH